LPDAGRDGHAGPHGGAAKPKIMFVSHNHPAIRPGGSEAYAFEAYEAMRDAGEFDVIFLARSGPPYSIAARHHEGRPITLTNTDPNQYLFYTDAQGHDWLYGRSPHKSALTRFYADFLLDHKPDIVHFQHTMFLGYDILRITRNTLPDVPIVYTIHDHTLICHRDGQQVRTLNNELCREESPRRCHECFPDLSQQTFFMRKRFIQSQLSAVDLFVTPSPGALERYVKWGIPRSKIVCEPHGRPPATPVREDTERPKRNRFGFFGQFTAYKGADVLLEAMSLLGEDFDGRLWIHGANLDTAPEYFQERFGDLIEDAHGNVRLVGQYESGELSKLMERIDWVVVPSITYETGPLTLLEAFQRGRPVICSDFGGMAEKVTDEVNGLHFRRGNAHSLAAAMRRAADTPGLWKKLRRGIPKVQTMDEHVGRLSEHYRSLLAGGRPGEGPQEPGKVLEHA
jgi:glycosyltransferase involved in cell wall biosynthesis